MRKFVAFGLWGLIGLLPLAGPARAEVQEIVARVDGLSCPFCAYGLEKKLKNLKGVEALRVDLKGNRAVIIPQAGKLIPVGDLKRAIKWAGFTPRGLRITVTGRLIKTQEGIRLQSAGTSEVFLLTGAEHDKLVNLPGIENKTVTVTGSLQEETKVPTVAVESVQVK